MKPRRRTILKVIALLAAGAALNVAVAWMDATGQFGGGGSVFTEIVDERTAARWAAHVPSNLNADAPYRYKYFYRGIFGSTKWLCWASIAEHAMPNSASTTIRWTESQSGWPATSLQGEGWWWKDADSGVENVFSNGALPASIVGTSLPTRPLWPGFAINTVFYAGVLWMLFGGPFALRRMIRRRRGQCAQCSYPIGQNEHCTECGAAVIATHPASAQSAQ